MARLLPDLSEDDFIHRALAAAADEAYRPWLTPRCLVALWRHYQELRRWNRLVSLVGPGTADELWRRHYGESLAAVPWLAELAGGAGPEGNAPPQLLDLGSGAGFPGFVLAAAIPGLAVTMVEAKEKKWAFLEHAARRSGVSCRALQLRLEVPLEPPVQSVEDGARAAADGGRRLPLSIDVLTVRALRLSEPLLAALRERMLPGGRLLRWAGGDVQELRATAPQGFRPGRVLALAGSERRFLVESVAVDV